MGQPNFFNKILGFSIYITAPCRQDGWKEIIQISYLDVVRQHYYYQPQYLQNKKNKVNCPIQQNTISLILLVQPTNQRLSSNQTHLPDDCCQNDKGTIQFSWYKWEHYKILFWGNGNYSSINMGSIGQMLQGALLCYSKHHGGFSQNPIVNQQFLQKI